MKPVKFIHTADWHIGIDTYGRIDPVTGLNTRVLDTMHCIEHIVDVAIREQIDVLLFAGDLFKSRRPSSAQHRLAAEQFARLKEEGIEVVAVPGNHDQSIAGTALDVYVETSAMAAEVGGYHHADRYSIACMPWGCNAVPASCAKGDYPRILLGHLTITEAVLDSGYSADLTGETTFPVSAFSPDDWDYVALGHIHGHQVFHNGRLPIVYPGSPDRCSFNEENQTKGYVIGEVWPGGADIEFRETPARRFQTLNIYIQDNGSFQTQGIGIEFTDAIVRVRAIGSHAAFAAVSESQIARVLDDIPIHAFAGIVREYTDTEERRRDVTEFTTHLTPIDAFERWLDRQAVALDRRDVVLAAGREIVEASHEA